LIAAGARRDTRSDFAADGEPREGAEDPHAAMESGDPHEVDGWMAAREAAEGDGAGPCSGNVGSPLAPEADVGMGGGDGACSGENGIAQLSSPVGCPIAPETDVGVAGGDGTCSGEDGIAGLSSVIGDPIVLEADVGVAGGNGASSGEDGVVELSAQSGVVPSLTVEDASAEMVGEATGAAEASACMPDIVEEAPREDQATDG